jgi:hypothetical protein
VAFEVVDVDEVEDVDIIPINWKMIEVKCSR